MSEPISQTIHDEKQGYAAQIERAISEAQRKGRTVKCILVTKSFYLRLLGGFPLHTVDRPETYRGYPLHVVEQGPDFQLGLVPIWREPRKLCIYGVHILPEDGALTCERCGRTVREMQEDHARRERVIGQWTLREQEGA